MHVLCMHLHVNIEVARVRPTAVLLAAHLPIPDRSISTAFVATFFPIGGPL